MNIEARITELDKLGYDLYLDGGRIRYKCLALIEPPKDKVLPLLEVIKRNKGAVIEYLKPKNTSIPYEVLRDLYLAAFNRTGWTQGLMARPEVTQAEDRLNQIWLDCMEGRATLDDFKAILKRWEGIISDAIRQVLNG